MPEKITPEMVEHIAKDLLASFAHLEGYRGATIKAVYPMYDLDGRSVAYHEVKFSGGPKGDSGYAIISATENDLPVVEFSDRGQTHYEKLQSKVGNQDFKMVRFGPDFVTAEGPAFRLLATIGRPPSHIPSALRKAARAEGNNSRPIPRAPVKPPKRAARKGSRLAPFDYAVFKKAYGETLEHRRMSTDARKQLAQLWAVAKSPHSPDTFNYSWADGESNHCYFTQISPKTPPNNTDHFSGCGPTAWMNIFGWHDLNWTPSLLAESAKYNTAQTNSLTMDLHDTLGTSDPPGPFNDDQGFTWPEDMARGFSFAENRLLHDVSYHYRYDWWDTDALWVYRVGREAIDSQRPFIVGYFQDWHYAIGYGLAVCNGHKVGPITITHRWIKIFPAWASDDSDDKWIPMETIFGIWAAFSFTPKPYEVTVKTGDVEDAGTDADVYLTLVGAAGSSNEVQLCTMNGSSYLANIVNRPLFERGNTDRFSLSTPFLGALSKLRIRHDNKGNKPGWFLDEILIREIATGKVWVFPCHRWLATDEDDHKIDRELSPLETVTNYRITVATGNVDSAGTDANVYVRLYGSNGVSPDLYLDVKGRDDFERGHTDSFDVAIHPVGELSQILVGHDNRGNKPGWYLEEILVRDDLAMKEWKSICHGWLAYDEPPYSIQRMLAVS